MRFWSDYSRVYYHPRSVVQLNEYEVNSSLMPFERWATGQDLFRSLDREHDLVDRDLRPFVEEADQMQGIQVLAGFDDAWGGFAAEYLERLRDEYGKTPVWVWGLQDSFRGVARDKRLLRLANKARAITEAYKQASMVIPLAVPDSLPRSIGLDPSSRWHTSALLAAAYESVTLPTRLKDPAKRDTLGSMTDVLNAMGRQSVAGLQMSFTPAAATTTAAAAAAGETTDSTDLRQRQRETETESAADRIKSLTKENPEGVQLDVQFSPSDQIDPYQSRRNGNTSKSPRIFSQLLGARGYADESQQRRQRPRPDDQDEDGDDRMDVDGRVRYRPNTSETITRT